MGKCYESALGRSDGACNLEARYVAKLGWTEGPMMLCEEHAQEAREHGDVITIRSLDRPRHADLTGA